MEMSVSVWSRDSLSVKMEHLQTQEASHMKNVLDKKFKKNYISGL